MTACFIRRDRRKIQFGAIVFSISAIFSAKMAPRARPKPILDDGTRRKW
jgi:hypothetical protein